MRRTVRSFTAIAALVLAAAAFSQTLPPGVQKVTSVEGITEYSLPNGLRILLFPDDSKPKFTVNITYLVGSRFEGYGETGMAHLLEHLNFIQTKTRTDIKKELSDHGAILGDSSNGTTAEDRTNYYETLNATDDNLRWALGFEADRMENTRIEKQFLDKEMTVVRNEFEMGENDPGRILQERVAETAYIWHAYGHPTIGNKSDIENVPIDKLAAFYHKYYQPDNAILTVAGKFDPAKALAWIDELFGPIPRPTRVLDHPYTTEPAQDGERSVTLRRVGDVQFVMAMYHTPAGMHPDDAAVQVLSGVLGDVPSGRLYKALVDNKKAVGAGMDSEDRHDAGYVMAYAQLSPDQNLDEARQILLKTVENFAQEPPSKEEVDRVKTRIDKNIELVFANSQAIALDLTEYAAEGDWRMLFLERNRLRAVTPADVERVAKAYLKESNRTLGEFIPTKTPDRAEIPPTPTDAETFKDFKGGAAVSAGEVFDPSPSNIESRLTHAKLADGVKVVLLPKKTRGGTVIASFTARFGDEKSLFGKTAIAEMTGATLMRGSKTLSRQQIQDGMDRLKAQISVSGGVNNATIHIQTTEENLAGALKLAAEVLKDPAFPDTEFEQVRKQLIAGIEEGKSDPQTLALQMLGRTVNSMYPRGDVRYTGTSDESIEDLKKVTLEDVQNFYKLFYGVSEGEFTVVGQFDKDAVLKEAEELFGNWKSSEKYARILTSYHKVAPVNKKVETPDKQNAMSIGAEEIKMSDESADYPAMIMANYMLGGSLSARLPDRIRNKEGLSYGVGSQFSAPIKDDGGQFLVYAISNPQNAPKVETSMLDELAKTEKGGFTAEELAAAKKAWLQERVLGRSQDGALVGLLSSDERWGRTMQFSQDLDNKVSALTPEQVNEALRREIDPAGFVYIKAGDFKKANVYQ
ncbi:MAG TPA: pitrilysin family protein [Bryobacteraceae bacterium]|jgi:zinc protease|nr:pitrilysin family protein [Bryobacteraceae bacterium]